MSVNHNQPEEYKTGRAIFCEQEFIVNPDVLIPRIETEEIIKLVLKTKRQFKIIADVGCGSGCLGITLAKKFPFSTVYLSDISSKALETAQKNAQNLLPFNCHLVFLLSDLLTNYPPNLSFDLIVANLPYIPSRRIPRLPTSVKDFEPHIALDGGKRGTQLINKLITQLPGYLNPQGLAILEIDDTHTLSNFSIPKIMKAEIQKDQFKKNRFLILSCTT